MHQLSSPRIDPEILAKIQKDSLSEQDHLASAPMPKERVRAGGLGWLALLALVVMAVLAAVALFLRG
jgi:hypothetical protein